MNAYKRNPEIVWRLRLRNWRHSLIDSCRLNGRAREPFDARSSPEGKQQVASAYFSRSVAYRKEPELGMDTRMFVWVKFNHLFGLYEREIDSKHGCKEAQILAPKGLL
ncbi:hypothetical protein CEXT_459211 [Caerostris extrusa]|uniref:Uncharacterized protein n=1 Tax=Caerostris extrusa TaxID=172846 RepID=A0AAV4QBH7_CAEEX|nr:hypothetical protein CEXT_459211 [Caerostris extrusa]